TIQAQDSINIQTANAQYENKNYFAAIDMYQSIIHTQGPSAEVYYNLGNAYYKTNQIGLAIVNYERCLALSPRDADAVFNLQLANLKLKDKLEPVNRLFIIRLWHGWIQLLQVNQWLIISLICIWLALAGFAVFRFSKKIFIRKTGFYLFAAGMVFFIISLITTLGRDAYNRNYVFGIITSPSLIIKSEPSENSTNLMMLHEGLKLRILDKQNNWCKITLPDGNQGWALISGVTQI
ncbi:MAG: tetratricopeptide repeat protein, partial [Chitinophagales bacterium]